jgi:signal transduction histidine kinase
MPNHTLDIDTKHTSQSDWVEFKKIKLLMTPRSRLVDYVVRLGIFSTLLFQSNIYISAVWLLVSVITDILISKEMTRYNQRVVDVRSMAGNINTINRYKYLWYFNTLWFGITSLVFAAEQIVESQMVMICLMNLIGLMSVAKTSALPAFCNRIIFVVIFSQFLGIFWNIGYVYDYVPPSKHFIYIVYLLLQYVVLTRIGKVFFKYMRDNFKLQFDNKQLIDNLSTKSKLLDQERKIAIAANETIQRFYSNAAHDVRQPVYAMQMYASMLHDDASLGDILLPKIQQSCIGINSLFNSLFDFQQLRLGTIDYQPAQIHINALLDELSVQFVPLAQKKGLKIKFKPVDGDVFIDEILIKRILGNLIVNAIRYTDKGGLLVAVRHQKSRKTLSFEIWDTGQGIADENKLLIFNEFFKVPDQKIETDEGFGLGLSIVKQLAQLVAGSKITVKSKLNRGSVFKFSVPEALYSASWAQLKNEQQTEFREKNC